MHAHSVYDTDKHFTIDPLTRTITTDSTNLILIERDHNSERYTFEMPRTVEGHDMSTCDSIQIHFTNISKKKTEENSDFYTVTDVQISPDDENVIIFSWLISSAATSIVGRLKFSIRFACTSIEGVDEYVWNTAFYDKVVVSNGIFNTKLLLEEYSDFVNRMESLADESLKAVVAYRDGLNEISEAVLAADEYIEGYKYKELIKEVNDFEISNSGSFKFIENGDYSFLTKESDSVGFEIEVTVNDHDLGVIALTLPDTAFLRAKLSDVERYQLLAPTPLRSNASEYFCLTLFPHYCYNLVDYTQTKATDSGVTVYYDHDGMNPVDSVKIYKVTKSLHKHISDVLDEINGEVI